MRSYKFRRKYLALVLALVMMVSLMMPSIAVASNMEGAVNGEMSGELINGEAPEGFIDAPPVAGIEDETDNGEIGEVIEEAKDEEIDGEIEKIGDGTGEDEIEELEELKEDGVKNIILAELPLEIKWQSVAHGTARTQLNLPDSLATITEPEAVKVTWETDGDYAGEMGIYIFTPTLPTGYTLISEIPEILVVVRGAEQSKQGRGMMGIMAMGGGAFASDPFLISTAAQLKAIGDLVNAGQLETMFLGTTNGQVHLKLANDIDLSAYGANYDEGKGWMPIGSNSKLFKGVFDGGNHKITGLYINRPAAGGVADGAYFHALFGYIYGGSVRNLGLPGVDIAGYNTVGGMAGMLDGGGRIENCYVTGTIKGDSNVGGIVGQDGGDIDKCFANVIVTATDSNYGAAGGIAGSVSPGGKISNSYSAGSVNTPTNGGGIVGFASGAVENSYSLAAVIGSDRWIGGIAGNIQSTGSIKNCVALNPKVSASISVGRVGGVKYDGANLVNNSAFDGMTVLVGGNSKTINNSSTGLDGESKTAEAIKTTGFFSSLFGSDNDAWTYADGELPILAGFPVDVQDATMPVHIKDSGDSYFNGEGTTDNPYEITTAAQLAKLAELVNSDDATIRNAYNSKEYKLMKDLDLSAYGKNYDGGKGWIPIGTSVSNSFEGVFDGGNHKITGLYINRPQAGQSEDGAYYHGLFGYIYGGSVRNLGLLGVDITGHRTVGGIAGMLSKTSTTSGEGIIENCYVTGTIKGYSGVGGIVGQGGGDIDKCFADVMITATDSNAGGIAGTVSKDRKISNCYSAGSVNTTSQGGGIVGSAYGAVENSYSLAAVIGSSRWIGGIAGYIGTDSSIKNCVALNPKVSGSSSVGRVGGVNHGTGNLNDNVAFEGMTLIGGYEQPVNDAVGRDGADKTAADIKAANFFLSLFGSDNDAWTYATGKLPILAGSFAGVQDNTLPGHISGVYFSGGNGLEGNPYQITTPAQLDKLAELVNDDNETIRNAYNSKEYKLMNDLDLSAYGKNYNNGEGWLPIGIKGNNSFNGVFDGNNHKITGLYINRPNETYQGLFGVTKQGSLKSLGIINANVTGSSSVGSLVGSSNKSARIENCYATGNITATNGSNAGGLVGSIIGTVKSSFFSGTVTGNAYVGGIVGDLANSGSLIENCYTNALVIGTGENVGGVAGRINMGTVKNCYAMSRVEGGSNVGGIAGRAYGTVSNCAALNPKVSGTSDVGRLVGSHDSAGGSLSNNWAFKDMMVMEGDHTKTILPDKDGIDGADLSSALLFDENFWSDISNWDTAWNSDIWEFAAGQLPTLKGIAEQKGSPDLHLIQFSTSPLSITLEGEGIYGSGGNYIVLPKEEKQEVTVKVKGWESWTDTKVKLEAMKTEGDGTIGVTPSVNGEVTLTIPANFLGDITISASSTSNPHNRKEITLSVDKLTLTQEQFTYVIPSGHIYNATARGIGEVVPSVHTSLEAIIKYNASAEVPKNAGSYIITLHYEGDDVYKPTPEAGIAMGTYTVSPRPVTVKADDKSMTTGSALPTFSYTVDGQIAGESAISGVPTISCAADGKTAGSYDITVNMEGITYTPNYTAASPASQKGILKVNNPSGSGSGSGGTSSSTTPFTPEKESDQQVTAAVSVPAITSTNGTAQADIPASAISDAIAQAQLDAQAQDSSVNGISVELNFTMPQGATVLTATLTQDSLNSLVSAEVTSLDLNGTPVSLSFDLKALKEIQSQSGGDISIHIAPAAGLSEEAQTLIGNRPVYIITISYIKDDKTAHISSLGNGTATISIPYTPGSSEMTEYIYAVHVDDNGNASRIPGSAYDANSGSVIFSINHFSVYGVSYTDPRAKFTDIDGHWAKQSIDYVVEKGLLSGTSATTFAPDTAMTRGMLVTVFGRLAGIEVQDYTASSFTDVAKDQYYAPYIEWAYSQGIVKGIGNQQFAPDRAVTREEMAVIFANYAKASGYTLPLTREATIYADASGIGTAYMDAVTAMQQAGIMTGDTNNQFNPKSSATRAEVSSMLHRYIKLTIDPVTAQG